MLVGAFINLAPANGKARNNPRSVKRQSELRGGYRASQTGRREAEKHLEVFGFGDVLYITKYYWRSEKRTQKKTPLLCVLQ